MYRLIALFLLVVMLPLLGAGCTAPTDGAEPGADGLHSIVPQVTGLSEADAASALAEAGYGVGSVTERASGDTASGQVIEQDPIAGTSAARDSLVDLVIAE